MSRISAEYGGVAIQSAVRSEHRQCHHLSVSQGTRLLHLHLHIYALHRSCSLSRSFTPTATDDLEAARPYVATLLYILVHG